MKDKGNRRISKIIAALLDDNDYFLNLNDGKMLMEIVSIEHQTLHIHLLIYLVPMTQLIVLFTDICPIVIKLTCY